VNQSVRNTIPVGRPGAVNHFLHWLAPRPHEYWEWPTLPRWMSRVRRSPELVEGRRWLDLQVAAQQWGQPQQSLRVIF